MHFLWLLVVLSFLKVEAVEPIYRKYHTLSEITYAPWLQDPEFSTINQNYPECFPKGVFQDGRYLEYLLAKSACALDYGDFIECGIYTGKSLNIFASVLEKYDPYSYKTLYGIDSFEGLFEPSDKDIDIRTGKPFFKKGSCRGFDFETIKSLFGKHTCTVQIIKGWIPFAFVGLEYHTFCFAHIDVDLYQATLDALIFIYPRMEKGGIILIDDYGYPMCSGCRIAVNEFLKDRPEPLIALPSGQAFLIKQ